MGNITRIEKGGVVVATYAYDELNQLVSATQNGVTYLYQYDKGGNITGKNTTTGNMALYTYGDATWRDLLTAYNGQTITYDTIGNPLTYRGGMSFTWEGRQMQTATVGDSSIAYTYDVDGYRVSKTIDGVKTIYVLDGSKVIMEQTGSDSPIYFTYDVNGRPITMTIGSATYYYVYNLQGDVIAITNNCGVKLVEYAYDPWGKITAITGDSANTIGAQNPYRYRGYRYDTETGLYYLNSRYYDPETGRFINADGLASTGQGVLGFNMFAYCLNNPVNMTDPFGMRTYSISLGGSAVIIIGVSISIDFSFDDKGNIEWQYSYVVPGIDDTATGGGAAAGGGLSLQITNADTVYDLHGPTTYVGAGLGPNWFVGADIVSFSDASDFEMTTDGVKFSGGFGIGVDVHVTESYTRPIAPQGNNLCDNTSKLVYRHKAHHINMLF